MSDHADVVVIGASAGGVETLVAIAQELPTLSTTSIVIVLHLAPMGSSVLPQILGRRTSADVVAPVDGEALAPGVIYVAPPDRHVLVRRGELELSAGPRVNGHRPAVDPAMQTAASAYDDRAAGVILSGMLDDGAAGLAAIRACGGQAAVQDPEEALHAGMPSAALAAVPDALVLPTSEVASWIAALEGSSPQEARGGPRDRGFPPQVPPEATGTRITCPECGGTLFEDLAGPVAQYHCSVGHVFSPASLLNTQAGDLEAALWTAVRGLEDRATLLKRLAARARDRDGERMAQRWSDEAGVNRAKAQQIRDAAGFPLSDEE